MSTAFYTLHLGFSCFNPSFGISLIEEVATKSVVLIYIAFIDHNSIFEEILVDASAEVRQRMVDFAWASMHGFITLVLEGEIGGRDSSRGLKSRGLAVLAAMAETVVRAAR